MEVKPTAHIPMQIVSSTDGAFQSLRHTTRRDTFEED